MFALGMACALRTSLAMRAKNQPAEAGISPEQGVLLQLNRHSLTTDKL
jgi:hypothetical protein